MENKKDIGRAFKEKLEGLQASPADSLWDSISASLDETNTPPKYRIWQKTLFLVTGAVFLSAILIALLWTATHNPATGPQEPATTLPGNPAKKAASTQETISGNNDTAGESNTLTDIQQIPNYTQGSTANVPAKHIQGNTGKHGTTQTGGSHTAKAQTSHYYTTSSTITGKNIDEPATAAGTTHRQKTHSSSKAENPAVHATAGDDNGNTNPGTNAKTLQADKNTMADTGSHVQDIENAAETLPGNGNYQAATGTTGSKDGITYSQSYNYTAGYKQQNREDNTIAQTPPNPGTNAQQGNSTHGIIDVAMTDSIGAIVAADTLSLTPKDSLTAQNTKVSDTATTYKSFYAFAYIAPTLYGSLPKSSSLIGPEVSGTTRSKTVFNYGAAIGYRFNKKWGIRTGAALKKMELSTAHELKGSPVIHIPVPYGEAFLYNDFEGIDYANGISNGTVISALAQPGSHSASIDLVSRFSFLEIPVEATYQLLDNSRWGAYLTGGASMLFVTQNEVYAQNSRGRILMGSIKETNNGLSINLGLGLYYRFLPSVRFNLEPTLKYHITKFGDSNPLSFSILAGLQYNFRFGNKVPE